MSESVDLLMARMSSMKTLTTGQGSDDSDDDSFESPGDLRFIGSEQRREEKDSDVGGEEDSFDFDYEDEDVDFLQRLGSGTGRSSSGSRYQPHSQVRRYCDVRTAGGRGGAEDGGTATVVRHMRVSFDTHKAARRARALPVMT